MTRTRDPSMAILLGSTVLAACGVDDRAVKLRAEAGTSESGGRSGSGGASAGGADADAGRAGAGGAATGGRALDASAEADAGPGDAAPEGGDAAVVNRCAAPTRTPACPDFTDQLIVDVHTHHVDGAGTWLATNSRYQPYFSFCQLPSCASQADYTRSFFADSDTTVTVLTGLPAIECSATRTTDCGSPLTNDQITATRDAINGAAGSERVLAAAAVFPNDGTDPDLLRVEGACTGGAVALQLFPAWEPSPGSAFFLHDAALEPFFERASAIGFTRFFVHKGVPLPGLDLAHNVPSDVGPAARKYPGLRFIVQSSAFCSGQASCDAREGPFDPSDPAPVGTNALIKSLVAEGIAPGSNVYVELGLGWSYSMADPNEAPHLVGKLLRFVGEDNVLWGTSALFPSRGPQASIEAFRALQIPVSHRVQYGYPELTQTVKDKIFGLNAARLFGLSPAAPRCPIQ